MGRLCIVVLACLVAIPATAQTSLLASVQRIRTDYPTPMSERQIGELVVRVAGEGGPAWGVLLKPSGSGCLSIVGRISCDILVHIPTQQEFDILADAEGEGVPTFNMLPFKCGVPPSGCSMDRVRAVAGGVTPKPDPPPPAVDLSDVLARLDALQTALIDLSGRVQALVEKPVPTITIDFPIYQGRVPTWGGTVTLRPIGK